MKLISDHIYGFTYPYLQAKLTKEQIESLDRFMIGQTMAWDDNLNCGVIYSCDIENWLHKGKLFWD